MPGPEQMCNMFVKMIVKVRYKMKKEILLVPQMALAAETDTVASPGAQARCPAPCTYMVSIACGPLQTLRVEPPTILHAFSLSSSTGSWSRLGWRRVGRNLKMEGNWVLVTTWKKPARRAA